MSVLLWWRGSARRADTDVAGRVEHKMRRVGKLFYRGAFRGYCNCCCSFCRNTARPGIVAQRKDRVTAAGALKIKHRRERGKAVLRRISEQFGDVVDDPVVIGINREQAVACTDPTGLLAHAVAIKVEIGIALRQRDQRYSASLRTVWT
jgi:hypothetical protein